MIRQPKKLGGARREPNTARIGFSERFKVSQAVAKIKFCILSRVRLCQSAQASSVRLATVERRLP